MKNNKIVGIKKMSCNLSCFCVLIVLLQIAKRFLPWLYNNLIGPNFIGPKVDVEKMGKWAVITGATEGIGKAYAKALAKKGLNVILISRSLEKLEKVKSEIAECSQVEVKLIDVDFTSGPEIYTKISTNIQNLEIGVLVNNVGMSYTYPDFFLNIQNEKFLRDIITCNINSVTHMCRLIMPQMIERKRGIVINISSMAAHVPNPLLCLYSGTKAFIDKFSDDLNTEYKGQGIIVQSVMPGYVVSNMTKIKRPTLMAPSADCYVASALRTLGISAHTTGYFPHALMKLAIDAIRALTCDSFLNSYVMKNLFAVRKRALRNAEKKAE
ncbi:very-long-chain 3-oxoacyl-CoA reductase-B [Condylostylus longicornis]|uniref:very-long-chain 3-oxoacyl-CoA reductase-B n=1 Tax=Condylostylus longicornis TaxID=2530218 RepID=UPI00244DAC75|nr:very-long-chain 3-oxoacyl-CoA reductase-B [Condylostylus longicornis]